MEFLYQDAFPSTQKAKYVSVFLRININSDLISNQFFLEIGFWWAQCSIACVVADQVELVYVPGCHWKESVVPIAPFLSFWTVSCEATWLSGVIRPHAESLFLAAWISTSISHNNSSYSWLLWPEICCRWNLAFGANLPTPLSANVWESGPLSLVGRHQFLKARKSLEVESCRPFSSLVKYCFFPCKYLE